MSHAIGIDIGGTGIKGALVDLDSGELASDRVKRSTPENGEPTGIIETVREIVHELEVELDGADAAHLGVCFPAIVLEGRTMSAANVSDAWIGLDADTAFGEALGRDIHFVNDADAAGFAEARFGAASALIHRGTLIPNSELGHLEIDGADAESRAANSAREREELSFAEWAERLQRFYSHVEFLFSPSLFVVGGGISKSHEEFLPLLDLRAPIVPAELRNNAGIIGAAALAAD